MQGRRLYVTPDERYFLDALHTQPVERPAPGDYWRWNNRWYGETPNGLRCDLTAHKVSEDANGTITVSPSILVGYNGEPPSSWHGYLLNGVWREC